MKFLLASLIGLLLSACSHTVDFRANHFAVPVVADEQWGGQTALVGTGVTKVTLVNDVTTDPPQRNSVRINEDVNIVDLTGLNLLSFDFGLHVWRGIELFVEGSYLGARYQFLNHGKGENVWVGAVQGSYASRGQKTSATNSGVTSSAESEITSTQAGISLGYKLHRVVPYFSYVHEAHEVSTKVINGNGSYGPYADNGTHGYYSLGLSSHERGFHYAIEYSLIDISWVRGDRSSQNALGLKMGYAW